MNEQDLRELWTKGDIEILPRINFEFVEERAIKWQRKLKRKIELDVLLLSGMTVLMVPVVIAYSYFLVLAPFFVGYCVWYYPKLWQMYRAEIRMRENLRTKEYLDEKALQLTSFVRGNRMLALVAAFPFSICAYYVSLANDERTARFMELEYLRNHPETVYNSLLFCGMLAILAIIGTELLLRIFYIPSLDRVKELLVQFESE